MKLKLLIPSLLALYALTVVPMSKSLEDRPVAVKLGYIPDAAILKPLCLDQDILASNLSVLKVLFYYGSLVEQWKNQISLPAEYYNMFKIIETAIRLDPYNLDAYYLAQASFTWEINRAGDVNRLLEYGMKFRTWDPELPFYAGFNYAYFLHDYEKAAELMRKAADLSGSTFYASLAARYFYESGQNELGITFLEIMKKRAPTASQREWYETRQSALLAINRLQGAVREYQQSYHASPDRVSDLVKAGIITELPVDPYGGEFYLDDKGEVRTTSKLAFARPPEEAIDENLSN